MELSTLLLCSLIIGENIGLVIGDYPLRGDSNINAIGLVGKSSIKSLRHSFPVSRLCERETPDSKGESNTRGSSELDHP